MTLALFATAVLTAYAMTATAVSVPQLAVLLVEVGP